MNPPYQPREGDLPREELIKAAEFAIGPKGPWPGATLNFKATCSHCGARCTLQEDNKLYEEIECYSCGKKTKIEYGGFTVRFTLGGEK